MVFEPSAAPEGTPSEAARFVRDAFAKWAVLFPYLWLFRHGLWIFGLLTLGLWLATGALAEATGLRVAGGILPILLGCLVALEGPSLRAWKLRRKGYREKAVVEAEDEDEAPILYYAGGDRPPVTRETSDPPPFVGRPVGPATSLLDPPRRAL